MARRDEHRVLTRLTPALDADILDPDACEAIEGLVRLGGEGVELEPLGPLPMRPWGQGNLVEELHALEAEHYARLARPVR